jgi:hypothetical protein
MEIFSSRGCITEPVAPAPRDHHAVFVEPHSYTIHVDKWLTDTRKYIDSLNNHVGQCTTPADALVGFPDLPKRLPNCELARPAFTGVQKLDLAVDA